MAGRQKTRAARGLPCLRPGDTPPKRPHVLAVPGAEAPIFRVDLPTGVRGAARLRIARQQLADRLGVTPASLAILPFGSGSWDRVVTMDRARLEAWAESAGKSCRAVVPDYLALPGDDGALVLAGKDGDVLVRLGADDGFTAPTGVAPTLLARALASAKVDHAVSAAGVPQEVLAIAEAAGLSPDAAAIDLSVAPRRGIDLRAALIEERRASGLGLWLAAAAVALLAFGLWSAGVLVETRATERALAEVRAETEAVLRGGLVPNGPLLDVRAQVTRALGAGQAEETPADLARLDLLSRVSVVVFGRDLDVSEIGLDDTGLTLAVVATDFGAAEALAADLLAEGLPARTDTLRARDDGGVEARFTIAAPEGGQ